MKKNYFVTFLTEFFVLGCGILVYRLAAVSLGKSGFGEYALARRAISFLHLPLLLGLGISIPRYIAFSNQVDNEVKLQKADIYFVAGFSVGIISVMVFFLLINIFTETFAYLVFGSHNYKNLVMPVSLLLVGGCLHTLIYSYYRGHLMMFRANFLQFINVGIIPLLIFAISDPVTSKIFLATGICQIFSSSIAAAFIFSNLHIKIYKLAKSMAELKEILGYGIPRLPGEFSLMGLLTLPAIFTAHSEDVTKAGFVAFGISLLVLIGSLFNPVGLVILPSASKLWAEGKISVLRYQVLKLLKISLGLTVFLVLLFEIFAYKIIEIYLGHKFVEATGIIKIMLIGTIPYVVYIMIRNVLDAISVKPLNARNLLIAFLFFIFLYLLNPYLTIPVSFCLALFVLGILSIYEVEKKLKNNY